MAIGRRTELQVTHQIRGQILFSQATPLLLGTMADQSRVLRTTIYIDIVFNAGTTNVLNVDDNVTTGRFLPTATVVPGTLGIKSAAPSSGPNGLCVGDVNVYATYTQTGTAATTGQAEVILEFSPPNG